MDKLAELQQKHPGKAIARVKTQGREFYLASPTREQWHAFLDQFADQRRSRLAMEALAKKCTLSPTAEELDELFLKKPGLAAKLSEAVGKLAGVDDEAEIELFDAG